MAKPTKSKPTVEPLAVLPVVQAPPYLIWLVSAFLLAMPLAEAILYWSSTGSAGNELTRDRSRFLVVNALTLTGFPGGLDASSYLPGQQAVLLILTLGGMLFSTILSSLAVVRIAGLRYSDAHVIRSAVIYIAALVACGTLVLFSDGVRIVPALMLSASALGNSGLYFAGLPDFTHWITLLVLLPLGVLGGLGLPVWMELVDWFRTRQPLSHFSRIVLAMAAGCYLIFFVGLLAVRVFEESGDHGARWVVSSSVAVLNARSIGFPFELASDWPRGMNCLLMLAMLIGGAPGGMAGGLKTTTLARIWSGARALFQDQRPGKGLAAAMTWAGIYLGMVGLGFMLLILTVPQVTPDRLLFLTISALGNVGLSHETVSLVTPGLDVLTCIMLIGRLAPMGMLWWMAMKIESPELPVG